MSFLTSLLPLAAFMALFMLFPDKMMLAGEIFAGLIAFILVGTFAFAYYVQYRQKKGNPIKGITVTSQHVPAPFVGMPGQGISLRVRLGDAKIRIGLSPWDYAFIIGVCFLFGPVFITEYLMHASTFHFGGPLYVKIALPAMVLISAWMFLRYLAEVLWHMPVVEVTPEGIGLWRGQRQMTFIPKSSIMRLEIVTSEFITDNASSNRLSIDNYTLAAVLTGEAQRGLCLTDNRRAIDGLKDEVEQMLNLTATA